MAVASSRIILAVIATSVPVRVVCVGVILFWSFGRVFGIVPHLVLDFVNSSSVFVHRLREVS